MQSYRLITVATLVDRLKINGSLARQSLKDLEDKGQIKKVVGHSKLSIYSKCPPFTFLSEWEMLEWKEEVETNDRSTTKTLCASIVTYTKGNYQMDHRNLEYLS